MRKKAAIDHLARFGFTQYEAQAYVALLEHGSMTGYEIAAKSGVPRSRVYDVLRQLVEKSFAAPIHGDPVRYRAQSATTLLETFRADAERSLQVLADVLPNGSSTDAGFVWEIDRRNALMARAEDLVTGAREEILLYCFEQELAALLPVLERRAGIKMAIVQFGEIDLGFAAVYRHLMPDQKRGEKGGRQFTLVVDDTSLLQGIVRDGGSCEAIWSTSPPLIDVARDFVRHDIYCWRLISRSRGQAERAFGRDFSGLRDVFEPKSGQHGARGKHESRRGRGSRSCSRT